jgi:hypothetical protein
VLDLIIVGKGSNDLVEKCRGLTSSLADLPNLEYDDVEWITDIIDDNGFFYFFIMLLNLYVCCVVVDLDYAFLTLFCSTDFT